MLIFRQTTKNSTKAVGDFATQFKSLSDSVQNAAKTVLNILDQWSFKALVDNLKQTDPDVFKDTVDQMVKEQKPLCIAPLFFVSRMHPIEYCRNYAAKGLKAFGKDKDIEQATAGKTPEEATKALIEKFGNYKR